MNIINVIAVSMAIIDILLVRIVKASLEIFNCYRHPGEENKFSMLMCPK